MTEHKGFSHLLTEAWIATDYFVEINGCEVREPDILDLEIMFGGCSVDGVLTIQDSQGIMSGVVEGSKSVQVGGLVRVGWSAALGCGGEYDETFHIEKVRSTTDSSNKKLLVIDLVDADTRNAKGAYTSKNYNKMKPSEILKEHVSKTIKPGIPSPRKLNVVGHKDESKTTMTTPSNSDAFSFMNTWMKQTGMTRIKDKFTDHIISKQLTEFDKLVTAPEEFEVDPVSEFSFWRVIQYNLDGYDVNALLHSIPMQLTDTSGSQNHDGDSKESLNKDMFKVTHEKSAIQGNAANNVHSRGTKTGVKNTAKMQQYFTVLSNAQTCSIWVPGMNINRIGYKSIVNFPKPSYVTGDEHDDVYSGMWEITAVRDKIIKQFFVQELFLRRVS